MFRVIIGGQSVHYHTLYGELIYPLSVFLLQDLHTQTNRHALLIQLSFRLKYLFDYRPFANLNLNNNMKLLNKCYLKVFLITIFSLS